MNQMMHESLYGNYRTRKFVEIFPSIEEFMDELNNTPFVNMIPDVGIEVTYYLLYANFGNSPISNSDENQFKYRVWSTMFMYGPAWHKRLEVQTKLIGLSETDILTGGKAIYNHAYNDGSAPTTASLEALDYINDQNVTSYKKSKMEGYAMLLSLIKTDVTKEYIDKFKPLFLKFVTPELPLWYEESENLEV